MAEQLIVRTDSGTGKQTLCSWDRASGIIGQNYQNSYAVLRQLALGQPIRCMFATYQHRDFVEGFERKGKALKTPQKLYETDLAFADEHRGELVAFLYRHYERADFVCRPFEEGSNLAMLRSSKQIQNIAHAYLAGLERGQTLASK